MSLGSYSYRKAFAVKFTASVSHHIAHAADLVQLHRSLGTVYYLHSYSISLSKRLRSSCPSRIIGYVSHWLGSLHSPCSSASSGLVHSCRDITRSMNYSLHLWWIVWGLRRFDENLKTLGEVPHPARSYSQELQVPLLTFRPSSAYSSATLT